ncbi:hypothetical protein [Nonomuraea sp. CA-141351]|uniref:hypothetical protein n=1 Tax=Nonomuraea sp. CA-141351 TaxID=3239996 RepID=UPI003D89DE36
MQRAAQTFHMPTREGWRTIAAGSELADDDPAVTTAPQYFVHVPDPARAPKQDQGPDEPSPDDPPVMQPPGKPARRASQARKSGS